MDDVKRMVGDYIERELLAGRVALQPEEDLLGHPSIDSLGVVGLVAFLEQRFAIDIPPEDVTIENFRTVAAISTYVDRRRG